jgi:hypothetical protein
MSQEIKHKSLLIGNAAGTLCRQADPDQSGGCFIKGTRVHTREGLKPIEEIQVGDYVLSSPEDASGQPEYRQVVNTFKHEKKRIFRITYSLPDRKDAFTWVTATGNHLFWVEGVGWKRADKLKHGQVLRAADGSRRVVASVASIYRTKQEGIGWISAKTTVDVEAWGSCFDYANYAAFPDPEEKFLYIDAEILKSENPFLEVTVYNFEVEGHHTYFVGSGGIWVHNTHCAKVRLLKEGHADAPTAK